MNEFWAWRVNQPSGQPLRADWQQMSVKDLTPGEVLIESHYSSVNYKDALALTGKGKILKHFPRNAGIDVAGRVVESKSPQLKVGQSVLVTGCGIGEVDDGGFAEFVRVRGDSVVPLPPGLSTRETMILGTAGFTAALALHRMLENHQTPKLGPIAVTGASGGVGVLATQILHQQGFKVIAITSKAESADLLRNLGAVEVVSPLELQMGSRPLESVCFGGAIDNVGGKLLRQILAHVELWGNVAAIGLADSPELNGTVLPFILRGVSLLGISSNNCPRPLRLALWQKLGGEWRPHKLESVLTQTVPLKDVKTAAESLIQRKNIGRILVEIRKPS